MRAYSVISNRLRITGESSYDLGLVLIGILELLGLVVPPCPGAVAE